MVARFLRLPPGSRCAMLRQGVRHCGGLHKGQKEKEEKSLLGEVTQSLCPGRNFPAIVPAVLISLNIFYYLMEFCGL